MVNVKSEGQAIQWNQSIIQWINKAKRSFIHEKYEDKSQWWLMVLCAEVIMPASGFYPVMLYWTICVDHIPNTCCNAGCRKYFSTKQIWPMSWPWLLEYPVTWKIWSQVNKVNNNWRGRWWGHSTAIETVWELCAEWWAKSLFLLESKMVSTHSLNIW